MYCKKCGNQIDEGAAFCKKCGTPLKETQGTQKEKRGIKIVGRKQAVVGICAAIAAIVLLAVVLLGKKDKYTGYYTCITNGRNYYALQIDGDRVIGYGSGTLPYHEGNISTAENCVYAYFLDADWQRYSPLTITLSDNGEKMYFASEDSRWRTDTYDVVSKSEYEAFLQEYLADEVEEHKNAE